MGFLEDFAKSFDPAFRQGIANAPAFERNRISREKLQTEKAQQAFALGAKGVVNSALTTATKETAAIATEQAKAISGLDHIGVQADLSQSGSATVESISDNISGVVEVEDRTLKHLSKFIKDNPKEGKNLIKHMKVDVANGIKLDKVFDSPEALSTYMASKSGVEPGDFNMAMNRAQLNINLHRNRLVQEQLANADFSTIPAEGRDIYRAQAVEAMLKLQEDEAKTLGDISQLGRSEFVQGQISARQEDQQAHQAEQNRESIGARVPVNVRLASGETRAFQPGSPELQRAISDGGQVVSKSVEGTEAEVFGDKTIEDTAKARVDTAQSIANVQSLITKAEDFGPGIAGLRGIAAESLGGLLGQVNDQLGRSLTGAIADVDPEQLTAFRQNVQALITQLVPTFTAEEGDRVTDRELAISAQVSRLKGADVSFDQMRGALWNILELKLTDSVRQDLMLDKPLRWDLDSRDGATKAVNELASLGIPKTQIADMLLNIKRAHAEFRRTGLFK